MIKVDDGMALVLEGIARERERQKKKFPDETQLGLPDGTGEKYRWVANKSRAACDEAAAAGSLEWRHILAEEFGEAMAESDPALLRKELIEVAAVCVKWIEALDRRSAKTWEVKT